MLRGWREWGEGLLDRLAGMFAFALLETGSGRCVLVRDRLGIKPLYLAELPGGGLRAASTLPALLAAGGVDTSVDPVALHHYLSWHSVVPAPRTILSGVRKLAAGHRDGGRARRHAAASGVYWNPPHERDARALARRSGATRCSTRCAWPCGGGWSPTCRSACCSPAGWTRA